MELTSQNRTVSNITSELRNYTELRATIVEGRKISGIAVPYNKTSHLIRDRARPYRERFLKGALKIDDNVALYISHDHRSIPLALGQELCPLQRQKKV